MNECAGQRPAYRDLGVWKAAMALADAVDLIAKQPHAEEHPDLLDQMRRAAATIPAQIVQSQGCQGRREAIHHLTVARKALLELENHVETAARLRFFPPDQLQPMTQLAAKVGPMLRATIGVYQSRD